MRIIKQLLFIAGMLGLLGIYIRDFIDQAMIGEAAEGCDLKYSEAEALDNDEARLCREKKLDADQKEREKRRALKLTPDQITLFEYS